MNSTRMESEYLYLQATDTDWATKEISEMNSYWKAKLESEVLENPVDWLALMLRKVFYLANDWEQYNNLSYEYQAKRFGVLRYNPLGWGILLLGAAAACFFAWNQMKQSLFWGLVLLVISYSAGLLLFFISARFRLPLVPFLCVLSGGCILIPIRSFSLRSWRVCLGVVFLLGLAVLTFGNWFNAKDDASFVQDELLLSSASSQLGRDAEALEYAQAVLQRDPLRDEARRIAICSRFNLWLEVKGENLAIEHWQALKSEMVGLVRYDAATRFIAGVIAWREGNSDDALASWQNALRDFPQEAIYSELALASAQKTATEDQRDTPQWRALQVILQP